MTRTSLSRICSLICSSLLLIVQHLHQAISSNLNHDEKADGKPARKSTRRERPRRGVLTSYRPVTASRTGGRPAETGHPLPFSQMIILQPREFVKGFFQRRSVRFQEVSAFLPRRWSVPRGSPPPAAGKTQIHQRLLRNTVISGSLWALPVQRPGFPPPACNDTRCRRRPPGPSRWGWRSRRQRGLWPEQAHWPAAPGCPGTAR